MDPVNQRQETSFKARLRVAKCQCHVISVTFRNSGSAQRGVMQDLSLGCLKGLFTIFSTASGALVVGGVRDTYIYPIHPGYSFECSME